MRVSILLLVVPVCCLVPHPSKSISSSISVAPIQDTESELHIASKTTPPSTSKPTVWTVFNQVAQETGAINLGQGFPDWRPPQFVLEALTDAVTSEYHQYTRPAGHPPLVELLAMRYGKHLDRVIDPFNEIAITVGASQALFLALSTLLRPGDEVVLFEPFFDLYLKQISLLGAIPKFVRLGAQQSSEDYWNIDFDALERTITPRTKVLILNSPHNPTGKVFTRLEMETLASIVRRNPQITGNINSFTFTLLFERIVISDEVYKFSVYNPIEEGDSTSIGHYHFARLPDMWDRTITLSSCGKTFSVTGWQVGWMVGPSRFIRPVHDMLPVVLH